MRSILIAVIAVAVCATSAFADDSLMAPRFGNTSISKNNKNGIEAHIYFKADHTFTGKVLRLNIALKGTWTLDGTNFCMTYTPAPFGVKSPSCHTIAMHKLGDVWTDSDRTLSIVPGIQ
jgi:hypothetical protein